MHIILFVICAVMFLHALTVTIFLQSTKQTTDYSAMFATLHLKLLINVQSVKIRNCLNKDLAQNK